ncbi:helix-turn-helix domain-containing protein [Siphonobacter sp. SORGH_AS_0500]|uniref:helix-turn-helix domain-containing protein n=1 Tax=Siphonobacter sp. SORGH_AS_0500 TaxID=1864824 RepID=UPI0028561D48|nr:helix-turn-helix domain-containing protein [Siphonobacter sp. SORGH_AS_0500]MDR6197733.1 AraC family L-rhamnose operon regulatory protein RhaS [Siphonobacter sp. SORGH_AS_0500]
MKRYILHSSFSIYHFEASTWGHSVHKHTYFEIIFILKGRGSHQINGNTYPYAEGDVFLLGPEDFHNFEIAELTEFSFVRFNESIHKEDSHDKDRPWQPVIRTLLHTSSQSRGSIVENTFEKQKLHQLLSVLEAESVEEQSPYFEMIRDSLMRSILIILARNLFSQNPAKPLVKDSVEAILQYIKQHIYQPTYLTIDHLAETFHYAPAYISLFFKKQTGESLKQYITKYKIKLIEARLLYSQLSLKEIADEFGYTDESHFCKQFRKYTGTTPTSFRQRPVVK